MNIEKRYRNDEKLVPGFTPHQFFYTWKLSVEDMFAYIRKPPVETFFDYVQKLSGALFAYSSSELIRLPFTAPLLYFLTA